MSESRNKSSPAGHGLPASIEAEMCFLGSVLLQPEALDDCELPAPEQFYDQAHAIICTHLQRMRAQGAAIDARLLVESMKGCGDLERVGGMAYLGRVIESVVHAGHAAHYAKVVREKYERRQAILVAQQLAADASDETVDLADTLARHERGLRSIEDSGATFHGLTIGEAAHAAIKELKRRRRGKMPGGLPIGLAEFDDLVGGLFGGELIILAARPRCGKTSLAMQIAAHTAERGVSVLFASLEMSASDLSLRKLAGDTGIDMKHLRRGDLLDDELPALERAAAALDMAPVHLLDEGRIRIADLRRHAKRLHRKDPLGLVVVDYVGLMTPVDTRIPRHEQVAQITRDLKHLARDLGVPVLALAQLNRESESGKGRPQLSHLRESGSIEQDADMVLFLHREEFNRPDDPDLKNTAELIVAKNRNGPAGTISLGFEASRTRFVALAEAAADAW